MLPEKGLEHLDEMASTSFPKFPSTGAGEENSNSIATDNHSPSLPPSTLRGLTSTFHVPLAMIESLMSDPDDTSLERRSLTISQTKE